MPGRGGVGCVRVDSNHRPPGYEPGALPLRYSAMHLAPASVKSRGDAK